MIVDEKRSGLFDFLSCLSYLKADPTEQQMTPLFEKTLDPVYRTLRAEMLEPLKAEADRIEKYANESYNLFTSFFQKVNPDSAEEYLSRLESGNGEKLVETARQMLDLSEALPISSALEGTKLSDAHKWAMYSILTEADRHRKELVVFFRRHYSSFLERRKHLLARTVAPLEELKNALDTEPEAFFRRFVSEERATRLADESNFFYLVASPTLFYLFEEKGVRFLAMGCYLLPYLSARESVQREFIEKRREYLKILSDETRYGILQKLTEGIHSNKILAEMFGISSPGVSYQLNALTKSGIISFSKEKGRYLLNEEELKKIFSSILLDFGIHS